MFMGCVTVPESAVACFTAAKVERFGEGNI